MEKIKYIEISIYKNIDASKFRNIDMFKFILNENQRH